MVENISIKRIPFRFEQTTFLGWYQDTIRLVVLVYDTGGDDDDDDVTLFILVEYKYQMIQVEVKNNI